MSPASLYRLAGVVARLRGRIADHASGGPDKLPAQYAVSEDDLLLLLQAAEGRIASHRRPKRRRSPVRIAVWRRFGAALQKARAPLRCALWQDNEGIALTTNASERHPDGEDQIAYFGYDNSGMGDAREWNRAQYARAALFRHLLSLNPAPAAPEEDPADD